MFLQNSQHTSTICNCTACYKRLKKIINIVDVSVFRFVVQFLFLLCVCCNAHTNSTHRKKKAAYKFVQNTNYSIVSLRLLPSCARFRYVHNAVVESCVCTFSPSRPTFCFSRRGGPYLLFLFRIGLRVRVSNKINVYFERQGTPSLKSVLSLIVLGLSRRRLTSPTCTELVVVN